MACRSMANPTTRALVLARLPSTITNQIPQGSLALHAQATLIVDICADHPGGIRALRDALHRFDGSTFAIEHLDEFLADHGLA